MITVFDSLGNQEPLIDVDPSASIKKNTGGDYVLNFTAYDTPNNSIAYANLIDDAIIEIDDERFIVKQINEAPYSKQVTCIHEFFEAIDEQVDGFLNDGFYSITAALNHAFSESEWTYNLIDTVDDTYLKSFGGDNTIALLSTIKESFDIEFIPYSLNKVVLIYKRIGIETDYQIRYKHNLVSIEKQIDNSSVKTAIRVRYNQREDGSFANTTTYTSPNAGNYRKLKYAKTVEFDTTDENVARAYGANMINDTPEISIRCEFVHLQEAGYESSDIQLGNSFYLIDERLSENELARIVEIETFPLAPHRSPILTLANRVKYVTDARIKEQIKRTLLEYEAVKKGENNGGVSITSDGGIQAIAEESKSVIIRINATEGILIQNGSVRKFYVDTDGNVTFDGRLLITNGDGVTPLLEGFRDTYGGVLNVYDNNGAILARLGANSVGGLVYGGSLSIYSGGGPAGISLFNALDGSALVLNSTSGEEVSLTSTALGPRLNLGNMTYIVEDAGYINGEKIATEDWTNNGITNIFNDRLSSLSLQYNSSNNSISAFVGDAFLGTLQLNP